MKRLLLLRGFSLQRTTLIAALLAVLTVTRAAGANQSDVGMQSDAEAAIRLTAINSFWDGLGWQPVVVRIENRATQARTWELRFNSGGVFNRGAVVLTSTVISVPARSTSETVVFAPGPGRSGSPERTAMMQIKVTGPGVAVNQAHMSGSRDLDFVQAAVSPNMEMEVRRVTHAGGLEIEQVNPASWPADWRVWSSFSRVVLARDDYDALDGARRNALREWVSQGGLLWLIPTGGRVKGEPAVETRLGLGAIHSSLDTLMKRARVDGSLRVTPWSSITELVTEEDRRDWELKRPIVALVVFLVLFGIVLGPINVFVLAPASKRQRLFITVPALSLAASLLLGGVIVAKDGFGGAGVRRAVVVLVPGENKAVVFQQQVARTGVLLRKEFTLPADTLIGVSAGGAPGNKQVQPRERDGDTAAGAWFTSRAVQSHDLRRITPTRARVELVEGGTEGRAPVVQSSVTTTLRDFRYVDSRGGQWTADEVPPGRRVPLSAAMNLAASGDAPGVFRAFGGATELAPLTTHAAIAWRDDSILYTGRIEATRQP